MILSLMSVSDVVRCYILVLVLFIFVIDLQYFSGICCNIFCILSAQIYFSIIENLCFYAVICFVGVVVYLSVIRFMML